MAKLGSKLVKGLSKEAEERISLWDKIMAENPELVRTGEENLAAVKRKILGNPEQPKQLGPISESSGGNIVPDKPRGIQLNKPAIEPDEVIQPGKQETGLVKPEDKLMDVPSLPEAAGASPTIPDKKRSLLKPAAAVAAGGLAAAGLMSKGGGDKTPTAQEPKNIGLAGEQDADIQAASSPMAASQDIKKAVAKVQDKAQSGLTPPRSEPGPGQEQAGKATLDEYKSTDYSESLDALDKMKENLPKREKVDFEKKLNELKAKFAEDKDNLESRELRQTLVHAFTQLAAGLYGLNTGMDMSGLKFDKTDWKAKTDLAFKQYDMERDFLIREKDKQDRLAEKDEEFLRDVDFKKIGLTGKGAESVTEAENKGVSDINKGKLAAAEDLRKAQQYKDKQVFDAAESEKDRANRERIAKIAASSRESVADKRAAAKAAAPGKSSAGQKDQIDQAVSKRLSIIDKTLSGIASKKTSSQKQQSGEAALAALGYTPEQIADIEKNSSFFGKSKDELLVEELGKARQKEEGRLYKSKGASPGPSTIRVQGPSGDVASISQEAWDSKYSKLPGYKLVK